MAITMRDLIRNPSLIEQLRPTRRRCTCGCGQALGGSIEDVDERFCGPHGPVRADCYYGALGDVVERHPIASGGGRRG